jgi:competence protein ComGC
MRSQGAASRRQRGMMLVEILIVMAIIGMMGLFAVKLVRHFSSAQCKTSWELAKQLAGQVVVFETEHDGECPRSVDELVQAHYFEKTPLDPWGTALDFRCGSEDGVPTVDAWSAGPDKRSGSGDDISSRKRLAEVCH